MSSHNNQNVNGWIILDKPQGMSSNQALRKVQYLLHAKKAGHIGTLDPFATGVLPLAFGEATKLIPYIQENEKTYEFTLKFGEATSTDDIEGEVSAVSSHIPTQTELKNILPSFCGNIRQIPPKYSAVHVNGRRAYDLARQDIDFALPEREIFIKDLTLNNYNQEEATADLKVTCSKGTYIRALGRDIAKKLETCGHLTALRRTKNGFFDLSHTILLENLKNTLYKDAGVYQLLPVETFLCDITVIAVTADEALKLKNGLTLSLQGFEPFSGTAAACFENKLIALIQNKENKISPIRVFNL